MPSLDSLAFWLCSFWVCFFGGCMGVGKQPADSGWVDGNRFLNQRVNDHSGELMTVRNDMKWLELRGDALHKHHMDCGSRMVERYVGLADRIKRIEERMVIVIPDQMPDKRPTMDPRELDPSPNIPPQKLPITPKELP